MAEDISAAKATVSQAQAAVETAKGQVLMAQGAAAEVDTYLDDAEIKAPICGRVTSLNVNAGELISTGMPLAVIACQDDFWVEVKVPETDLSLISIGQKVNVSIAAYPEHPVVGEVVKVSQKPDFATKRSTKNNGDFDVLSYGVKIVLPNMEQEVYPGMTVLVDFASSPAEGMTER